MDRGAWGAQTQLSDLEKIVIGGGGAQEIALC